VIGPFFWTKASSRALGLKSCCTLLAAALRC